MNNHNIKLLSAVILVIVAVTAFSFVAMDRDSTTSVSGSNIDLTQEVSTDKPFGSYTMNPGDTFSYTFMYGYWYTVKNITLSGASWITVNGFDHEAYGKFYWTEYWMNGKAPSSGTYDITGSFELWKSDKYDGTLGTYHKESTVPFSLKITVTPTTVYNTVTWNAGSGSCSTPSTTVVAGNSLTAPTPTPPTGYSFNGWYTSLPDGTHVVSGGASYTPTRSMTLYAAYSVRKYSQVFYSDGEPLSHMYPHLGDDITLPSPDEKIGYTFKGWHTAATGGTLVGMAGQTYHVTKSNSFYAVWEKDEVKTYTLTFAPNDGSGTISPQTVMSGLTITLPNSGFIREGYYLSGWLTGSTAGAHRDLGSSHIVTGDITFYAEWTAIPPAHDSNAPSSGKVGVEYVYKPTLVSNSAWLLYNELGWTNSIIVDEIPQWLSMTKSDRATHEILFSGTPTQAGVYKVSLHLDGNSSVVRDSKITWIITVMNDGDPNYAVSFNANGGSGDLPGTQHVPPNNAVILPGAVLSKPGYTMVAWSTVVNGTTVYYPLGSMYTATGNTVFTAYYSSNPNIVILDANGGSSDGGLMSAFIAYTDGQVTLPSSGYTKAGNAFRGWFSPSDPNTVYAPGFILPISGSMTLKAYWIPVGTSTVTVTFNANGGTGSLSQIVESGKKVMLPSYGFDFIDKSLTGWTQGSTSGTAFGTGVAVAVSSSTTFHAKWADSAQSLFTVSFDLNGGSGSIAVQNISSGGKATLPPTPIRSGHIFAGWKVVGGQGWDFNTAVTQSMTLQAQWTQHFSVTADGTNVTLTMGSEYASKAASISWGDGKTSTGSSSSYAHDYGTSKTVTVTVTSTINGTQYTSSMQVYVSAPGQGGGDEPEPPPEPPPEHGRALEAAVIIIVTVIGSMICIALFPPSAIAFWILMAAISVWRFLI